MRLLALETSTEYCSVALWQDGIISSRCVLAGQKHSELLIAMLDEVLREAGVKLAQLDGIAFGAGPGSFTGVRIACGVTQGLAFGAGLPVVGCLGWPDWSARCSVCPAAQPVGRFRRDGASWWEKTGLSCSCRPRPVGSYQPALVRPATSMCRSR